VAPEAAGLRRTADGFPDLVQPGGGGITVQLNLGYRFGQPEFWSASGYTGPVRQTRMTSFGTGVDANLNLDGGSTDPEYAFGGGISSTQSKNATDYDLIVRPYVRSRRLWLALYCSSRSGRTADATLTAGGRTMEHSNHIYVGIDVAKMRNAIAVADGARGGEVRYLGEVDASELSMRRVVKRIAAKAKHAHFCYEAGPTGYGLHRLITSLGHSCTVVAPSLIPKKPGDRIKTNRRDAVGLARLLRAGELTAVWVPDKSHEAMRDLVRSRAAAVESHRRHRQQISGFMLKHGRVFDRRTAWTMRYWRWLQEQKFEHPAHQIALQEMVQAVKIAKERVDRLEAAIKEFLPQCSLAHVVQALCC